MVGRPGRAAVPDSGSPVGTSMTPGWGTSPSSVSNVVPGSSGEPTSANRSAPSEESSASWAKVSTFEAKVGASSMPCWWGSTRRPGGTAGPPFTPRIAARTSPDTKPPAVRTTRTFAASRRSARAAVSAASEAWSWTTTVIRRVPRARATTSAPSRTRCGARRISVRSFWLAGSLSEPLTSTSVRGAVRHRAQLHAHREGRSPTTEQPHPVGEVGERRRGRGSAAPRGAPGVGPGRPAGRR